MKKKMESIIKETILILQAEKIWPVFDMPEIEVTAPQNEKFGDYSTNIAMILAKILRKKPMEITNQIISNFQFPISNCFDKIGEVAPGYINFYLSEKYLRNIVAEINRDKQKYGNSKSGKGVRVNNEFISANPTGPLHLGNGRGGFYGDVLSNILVKAGYKVRKEYYVNDAGEQVIKLGHSVLKDKDAVYTGGYIDELNKKLKAIKNIQLAGKKAADAIMREIIKKSIKEKMKIDFNSWISEKALYDKKYVDKAIVI